MNGLNQAFENIISKAAQCSNASESDYVGGDGLLYCSKCNTKKQTRVAVLGIEKVVPCICHCAAVEYNRQQEEAERQEYERRIERYRQSAGFSDKAMETWTFANDDMANPKLTQVMQKYVEEFPKLRKDGIGLLLWGSVGTGKTYAAACIVNALIDKGYPCMITSFSRIANILQGMREGKQEYLDKLNSFPLLVLDDLGAERKSEYMQEQVFNVIDNRYRMNLPIIVTTNMSMAEMKNMADIGNTRIYDRILERCHPVEMNGTSRRRKIVKDRYYELNKLLGIDS